MEQVPQQMQQTARLVVLLGSTRLPILLQPQRQTGFLQTAVLVVVEQVREVQEEAQLAL